MGLKGCMQHGRGVYCSKFKYKSQLRPSRKVAYVSESAQAVLPAASEASRASLRCLFWKKNPDPKRKLRFKK